MAQRTILIVGGGVIGLSIAEALSRRGIQPIVLEKGEMGREASWAGSGSFCLKSSVLAGGAKLEFSLFSLRLMEQWMGLLAQDSGVDPQYRTGPAYEVAFDETEIATLRRLYEQLQARRIDVRWKEGEEAREREPELSPEIVAAIEMPRTGQVRPPRLMKALCTLLTKRGVTLRDRTAVSGFLIEGGKVRGVKTSHEEIPADAVVLASGAWSGPLGERLGLKIPVRPMRQQVTLFSSSRLALQSIVTTTQVSIVPRGDGHFHVSAEGEEVGFNKNTTLQGVEQIETGAFRAIPGLRLGKMEARWAGLLPGSPDGLPFLGPVPTAEGLYLACGHSDQAFLMAPATGLLLDQILRGEEPDLPLEPFALSRPIQGSLAL